MKNNTIQLTSKNLPAITAGLIRQQMFEETTGQETKGLNTLIQRCMKMLPTTFKTIQIDEEDTYDEETGDAKEIKCPVTGHIVRADGESEPINFQCSPAFLANWADEETGFILFQYPEIEKAWNEFSAKLPEYEDYEDYEGLIQKFILLNNNLFAGRKLVLVTIEESDWCGGSDYSYALLDASRGGRKPIEIQPN